MFNFFEKTDSSIKTDVMNELSWDPSIEASQIKVTADDGIVTLRGTVPHYFDKSQAENAAQRVGGVRAVADELEVNLTGPFEKSDEDIAGAAVSALQWSYSAPQDTKVSVTRGWITLRGETEWDYQRTAAKDAVRNLLGVRGVTNSITMKSRAQPSDIKNRIEDALKRSAEAEGRKIQVSVKGNVVTLSGNVHSMSEKDDIRMAAWMAPGVVTVENNLRISQ
ncbi:MAG: BON domain-containing protein [Bdellovibrionales bacterium]|nr:BON domain-containing protein [Bdellovibrionales bacterium]